MSVFRDIRIKGDCIGIALRDHPERFVILVLEQLPTRNPYRPTSDGQSVILHIRKRENAWIHIVNSVARGYNSRVKSAAPPRLLLPSYGFGRRPIRRSRHDSRITSKVVFFKSSRRHLSRDWKRRVDYMTALVHSNPCAADT